MSAGRYWSYQIQGQAPVSTKGSTDETDIGTVSGLTAGASVHAGMSFILWPHQEPKVVTDLKLVCVHQFGALIPGYEWTDLPSSGVSQGCNRALFKVDQLKAIAAGFQASLD